MIRTSCLVCESKNLNEIVNLGMHPFADTFIPISKISQPDNIYPLVCELCLDCGHVQTKYSTDPTLRYAGEEYSYTSGNSNFSRKHWDEYAEQVTNELNLNNSFIIEVGSNDGYLAEQFVKKGNKVLGIDASQIMADLAKSRNVETLVGLFGKEMAEKITKERGYADLIIANNVFNHIDNLLDFVRSIEKSLSKDGSFVFEQPYWPDMLKNNGFNQIYHEHVNYFTIKALSKLFDKVGMVLQSITLVDYHGKSLRAIAKKKINAKESEKVNEMIRDEEEYGVFRLEKYKEFMNEIYMKRSKFMQRIHEIKCKGQAIIAIAAAAKGNTLLNFYKLDSTIIDYVTDASPYKKGKYTPATRIPIVGDEIIANYKGKVYALMLTGNLPDKIKETLISYNKDLEFVQF